MSIQWTIVAGILYAEIAFCLLLLLPWIRPDTWCKLFGSRWFRTLEASASTYSNVGFFMLILLLIHALLEIRQYIDVYHLVDYGRYVAEADAIIHMKLFRAQRNLYISGFALFVWLMIRYLISHISRENKRQKEFDIMRADCDAMQIKYNRIAEKQHFAESQNIDDNTNKKDD